MADEKVRIVQITDIHMFADRERELLGVNTQDSFQSLFNIVKEANLNPDFILLTGDLAQDGTEEAYSRLADQLSTLQIPVYCIPGNHDDSGMMERVYPRGMFSLQKQLVLNQWQIILLDSHIHRRVEGKLELSELNFLEKCLKEHPDRYAIVCFHHQPVKVNCEWLDNIGLKNADDLWELVARYPQTHTFLFGHIHQLCEGEKNGIPYYSTPSTCIQFKTNSDKFALEKLAPAYRVIDLYPNGKLETTLHRGPHYVGEFMPHAKGY